MKPYRPRKPPLVFPYVSSSDEALEVAVLRTHDREVTDPLALPHWEQDYGPLPEPRKVWARVVPWCDCGDGHSSHLQIEPVTELRRTGWVPAMLYEVD